MKFAVLGGSFNPVHKGHLKLAESALSLGYERIILIPAYQSPLKPGGQAALAEVRAEMLLASICGDRRFTVDMCEIKREGISYTIDTVRDITARYTPEAKIGLILGDDLVADFDGWKGADEIAAITDIIIARRNYNSIAFNYPHLNLHNDMLTLSSAEVRAAIAAGGSWHDFVPGMVAAIIEQHGLYGCAEKSVGAAEKTGGSAATEDFGARGSSVKNGGAVSGLWQSIRSSGAPPLFALENLVRQKLKTGRFVHSRNVALHCADLAARFGLDVDRAYAAGIAHDLCKDFSETELTELAAKDGMPLSDLEKAKPALLHGRAAAVFLRDLGVDDAEIIEAVRWHTTSAQNAGALTKLVYLADKIEVGRTTVDPHLRFLAFGPAPSLQLDELYHTIMNATHQWLRERGLDVAEPASAAK